MTRPRIGFLGVGWIGRSRMAAMVETGVVEAVAICEPVDELAAEALALAPSATRVDTLDQLLALKPDGVVIATPSALHAAQSIAALEAGAAVFCQKPLGRDTAETRAVVEAARAVDRLLGVDLSYRFTTGMQAIAALVRSGELGRVHAIDLTFHNAYGPDKPWFYDRAQSGGGCVVDLGVHLVDLAMWVTGSSATDDVSAALFSGGERLARGSATVEDLALATVSLEDGTAVRLACSWRINAGQDAVIEAAFYGTQGGAALRNVAGSFYDFTAERFRGTSRETLATPPDDWSGRAAADWARRLAAGERFDPSADGFVRTAEVLDRIYAA